MRIDVYIYTHGFAASRKRAQDLISNGNVYVNGVMINKNSYEIDNNSTVEIKGETIPYVSRGGLKLQAAIDTFQIDVRGKIAIDIGASTGGFTDCLLQYGADKVYAVDCGINQLDSKLLNDSRVISIEKCNARSLDCHIIPELCDISVMDVSFISQTLIYPAVTKILKNNGILISLIKPQFEAGYGNIGKNGIIKDTIIHEKVINNVIMTANSYGLYYHSHITSPIKGGDGNTEFLALFVMGETV